MCTTKKQLKTHLKSCTYDDFDKTFGYGIPSEVEANQCMDGSPTDGFIQGWISQSPSNNIEPQGKWVNKVKHMQTW